MFTEILYRVEQSQKNEWYIKDLTRAKKFALSITKEKRDIKIFLVRQVLKDGKVILRKEKRIEDL